MVVLNSLLVISFFFIGPFPYVIADLDYSYSTESLMLGCRARCLQKYLADENHLVDLTSCSEEVQPCKRCWEMCEVLYTQFENWSPACMLPADFCPGCQLACRFRLNVQQLPNDTSRWTKMQPRTENSANMTIVSWTPPRRRGDSHVLLYGVMLQNSLDPTPLWKPLSHTLDSTVFIGRHLQDQHRFDKMLIMAVTSDGLVDRVVFELIEYPSHEQLSSPPDEQSSFTVTLETLLDHDNTVKSLQLLARVKTSLPGDYEIQLRKERGSVEVWSKRLSEQETTVRLGSMHYNIIYNLRIFAPIPHRHAVYEHPAIFFPCDTSTSRCSRRDLLASVPFSDDDTAADDNILMIVVGVLAGCVALAGVSIATVWKKRPFNIRSKAADANIENGVSNQPLFHISQTNIYDQAAAVSDFLSPLNALSQLRRRGSSNCSASNAAGYVRGARGSNTQVIAEPVPVRRLSLNYNQFVVGVDVHRSPSCSGSIKSSWRSPSLTQIKGRITRRLSRNDDCAADLIEGVETLEDDVFGDVTNTATATPVDVYNKAPIKLWRKQLCQLHSTIV